MVTIQVVDSTCLESFGKFKVSRVPCVGELLMLGVHYRVTDVCHELNPERFDVDATIYVKKA